MKKILIISRSFYPTISPRSFRTTELVKEFARQGHDVTLLTRYDAAKHNEISKEGGFKIIDLGKQNFKAIKLKGNRIEYFIRKVLRRFLVLFFEYPDIQLFWQVKRQLKKLNSYDLIISIAAPHPVHWGTAFSIKKNKNLTKVWIADCGDPYMGDRTDTFRHPIYFKYFENKFCKLADYITVPIKEAIQAYYPKYQNKIKVIPQGFKFEEARSFMDPYVKNKVPTFVFGGTILPGLRDVRPILEYLLELDVDFKFYVFTQSSDLIQPYLEAAKGRVILSPLIPRERLLNHLSKMDFLLNIDNGKVTENLPSKLIDYGLSNRPILSVNSQNIDSKIFEEFLNGDYSNQLNIANLEQYDINNIAKAFIKLGG